MARVHHAIEKGLRIYAENSTTIYVDYLIGSGAPLGTSGETDEAPIGSQYNDYTNGKLYQKETNTSSAGDWILNGSSSASIGTWRSETLSVITNEAQGAGTRDMVASPFTDDDGTALPIGSYVIGEFVITDADGTPLLLEITNVSGDDVTYAVASPALSANDTFVARHYLPDPDGGENKAIVNYNGTIMLKISDIDWQIATGINLSGVYAASSGNVAAADTVEAAIAKLDGVNDNQDTLLGTAQGATNLGTFTGTTIPDSQTVKAALQAVETAYEETDANVDDLITLSGVAENATDLGTFTGTTIPDTSTNKAALQSLETAHEETDANVDDLITLSGVAENATDLGTFTGVTIPDSQTNKAALQALETAYEETDANVDDLITLSGVAENATDLGTFTGATIPDNEDVKGALQSLETAVEAVSLPSAVVTGLTTLATIDSVLVDDYRHVKWLVDAFEEATPGNIKSFVIDAAHNGTTAADATDAKSTESAIFAFGAAFNLVMVVDQNGAAGSQVMRLRASSSTAGVTINARRVANEI